MLLRHNYLHTLLFALAPVLAMFAHNAFRASWGELPVPLAFSLVLAVVFTAMALLLARSWAKAFLIATLALVLCFSYGHIAQAIGSWRIGGSPVGRPSIMVPLWGALLAAGATALIRTKRDLSPLTRIVNVVAIAAFLMPLINIGVYKATSRVDAEDVNCTEELRDTNAGEDVGAQARVNPDIYYIILDRYGSVNGLKSAFDFDNSEFVSSLESRNFYVASRSVSNYILTIQSVASSLNMDYINCMSETMGRDAINRRPLQAIFDDYRVWRFLKQRGYSFIHVGNGKHFSRRNPLADENINYEVFPEFVRMVLESTVFWPVINKLSLIEDARVEKSKRVHRNFHELAKVADRQGPTFVFAHFLLPHPPYVFEADGSFVTGEQERGRRRRDNFMGQLHYTNKLALELVDKLVASSDSPPIIILQGDEGPYPPGTQTEMYDWTGATAKQLFEKVGILNALYLPGVDDTMFYSEMTPVNTFRIVFNHYFGTDYELLPDRSFASRSQRRVYDFFEITDMVR